MQAIITEYLSEITRQYETGFAREHTYRPALQQLLAAMLSQFIVSNEPARLECGAPDYLLFRKKDNTPVAYIEAKDLNDPDLVGRKKNREQFDRYKRSLDNIIFTDYLDFLLCENGEFVKSVRIAELKGDAIKPVKENFAAFENLIAHFDNAQPQRIVTSTQLAEVMAGKARLMSQVIENVLAEDKKGKLAQQMEGFQDVLMHNVSPKGFADVYAQTIAYGMFAARLHDDSDHFNRKEAAELIPKNNPFLRELFQNIAGYNIDERIRWIVDDLAEFFRVADMRAVMLDFGTRTRQTDPMIHFYENFLAAYDPSLRKSRGVWFTPQEVVGFIVRTVDEILQTGFDLPQGLADTSKVKITAKREPRSMTDKQSRASSDEIEVHKVQILDPAVGTGTFLAETISHIHERFKDQRGMWQNYVEDHLIPRLNGFELLMASYTMAHINLAWLFRQTGHEAVSDRRFRIFLTNSLEEHFSERGPYFHSFLANEANEASSIKRDTPVMVVMGNPPYSGESQNKSDDKTQRMWIEKLLDVYKCDHQGKKIPNTKWVNNDYVKFIRFGQHLIEKTGYGVLAYITDNSYLDSLTFNGVRWNLFNAFDTIYVVNLHGETEESIPGKKRDENVFDITEGVSISIFVKTEHKKTDEPASIYYIDLYGKRSEKFDYLRKHGLQTVKWKKLKPTVPQFFFTAKNFSRKREYEKGFGIQDLFLENGVGICSKRDKIAYRDSVADLKKVLSDFKNLSEEEVKRKYEIIRESRDQKVSLAKQNIEKFGIEKKYFRQINYRPFDWKWTYHTNQARGFLAYPVFNLMRHFLKGENVGLIVPKINRQISTGYVFITKTIADLHLLDTKGDSTYVFPLYLYNEVVLKNGKEQIVETKTLNLNATIINDMTQRLGLKFTDEPVGAPLAVAPLAVAQHRAGASPAPTVARRRAGTFAPIDVLDYIYAVLHSPTYRERYKEFLKIDFPRVPYPEDVKKFWKLVRLGGKLRRLHLMEGVEPLPNMANFPVAGTNEVEKPRYTPGGKSGRVYINAEQYFDRVPQEAWEFYIGGYQPAQKWLKDRKGRKLNFDEIQHYQQIIRALQETGEVMLEIDEAMG